MIRNYLSIAIRQLKKNKLYSIINVLGLAMGMTCFMLLTLYVEREFSFDEHIQDSEQIFQVFLGDNEFGKFYYSYGTVAPMAELVNESIPEVTATVRFGSWDSRVLKVNGERFLYSKLFYTDKTIFETFELPFLNSDAANIQFESKDIVLSESEAIKFFGDAEKAIGQVVDVAGLGDFRVTGVFENLPENSHMDFEFLISFENVEKIHDLSEGVVAGQQMTYDLQKLNAFPLYLKVESTSIDLDNLKSKLSTLIETNFERKKEVELVPLEDIYFSEMNPGFFGKNGDKSGLALYILIAVIILIVAIVNYANLTTAQYGKRAKEVGIRKTMGGFRSQLATQFITESILLSFLSIILSICALEVVAPWFQSFSGSAISVDYSQPMTYLFLIGFALLIGLISGVYPAFYLSKLGIMDILSGKMVKGKRGAFTRQFLVGFQFFVCLSLIMITGIVLKQFNHMMTIDRGFNTSQIITFSIKDKGVSQNFKAFKSELLQNPRVSFVNGSTFSSFNGETPAFVVSKEGQESRVLVSMMIAESDFADNFGLKILEGRSFNPESEATNSNKILVNQATVEEFGWTEPLKEKLMGMEIIGVVDNFMYGSVKREINPLMIMVEKSNFSRAYVQLDENDIHASIDEIGAIYDKFSTTYPFEFTMLDDQFGAMYATEARLKKVFTSFSFLAIFIAGLGMLGLSLFIAEQRTKEVGIRKVLGASLLNIIWLLNTNVTKLIALSSLLALPFAYYFMSDWLGGFANRISLGFPLFVIPIITLLLFAWGILIYHSISVARANPTKALRSE